MSSRAIIILAADPRRDATTEALEAARRHLLDSLPEAESIEIARSEHVVFHDAGSNFESVACPSCETELDMETWGEWMDADFDGEGFRLEARDLACCGTRASLAMLR